MCKNARIYFWIPILLVIGAVTIYAFLPTGIVLNLLLPYFIWQTWHYQKQNLGVLSFVAKLTDSGRVTRIERLLLNTGVIAGILGFFKINFLGQHLVFQESFDALYRLGFLLMFGLAALFCYALVAEPQILKSPVRLGFLALTSFFYLPTFVFSNPTAAISSYALAHGLQYLVFMGFVSKQDSGRGLLQMVALSAIVGSILYACTSVSVLAGIVTGSALAHFVVDGHIWRMSQPFQREYLSGAFGLRI